MYVSREILSVSILQRFIGSLQKQKSFLLREFAGINNLAHVWVDAETKAIDSQIAVWQKQVAIFNDQKMALQKLSTDLEQAIVSYEKNCSQHAEQRTNSIFRIREWLDLVRTSNKSDREKHLILAKALVHELNSVEHDHNQSSFSRLFTESRLAKAYMGVLRDNCIDPYSAKYLENVSSATIVYADSKESWLDTDSISSCVEKKFHDSSCVA